MSALSDLQAKIAAATGSVVGAVASTGMTEVEALRARIVAMEQAAVKKVESFFGVQCNDCGAITMEGCATHVVAKQTPVKA
jgi:hypothetical protein